MKRNFCQACSFARYGVKTRRNIPHTCSGRGIAPKPRNEYVPTKEELDMYLKRLKELMNEEKP